MTNSVGLFFQELQVLSFTAYPESIKCSLILSSTVPPQCKEGSGFSSVVFSLNKRIETDDSHKSQCQVYNERTEQSELEVVLGLFFHSLIFCI